MLIFWDIDGTLLTTAKAGIHAWEEALQVTAGVDADLEQFDTAGHPDFGIARRLLNEFAGGTADPARELALVRAYEARLPSALGRRTGRVLPNVRSILERLAGEPGTCSVLLTGNTRAGAAAKLTHYGLDGFFRSGAFSEPGADRAAIARAALNVARQEGCSTSACDAYVIGDTPHDLRCAAAIEARAIGVATGSYSVAELSTLAPWRVWPELPSADRFIAVLRGREELADV